jgi:hypothetical protein
MAKNRYDSASKEEKSVFTKLNGLLAVLITLIGSKIHHRELREEKNPKYIFALGKNNPLVYTLEFRLGKDDIIKSISMVLSRVTLKSDFGKQLMKTFKDAKESYGGIVVRIPIENQDDVATTLKTLGTLMAASEELELDPKRTYFDPPTGWVEGVENPPAKKEKPAPKAKKEETPAEEPKA